MLAQEKRADEARALNGSHRRAIVTRSVIMIALVWESGPNLLVSSSTMATAVPTLERGCVSHRTLESAPLRSARLPSLSSERRQEQGPDGPRGLAPEPAEHR